MELSERISLIIKENKLKQKELASIMGVTETYVSSILAKRNLKLSNSVANLIEEKLGYSAQWILEGKEPKIKEITKNIMLSDVHKKAIIQIEKMTDEQAKAVLVFINSLEEIENCFKHNDEATKE